MKKLLSLFALIIAVAGYAECIENAAAEPTEETNAAAPAVKKTCTNCHCKHHGDAVKTETGENSSSEIAESSEHKNESN